MKQNILAPLAIGLSLISTSFAEELPIEQLNLPAGFTISVFAEVPNARQMARGARESWLLTHRPIAGLVSTELLPVPPGTATPWSSVTNTYASSGLLDRFDLMLSSHIHLAQAVTVPTLPPQVVLGNAGADPEPETGYAIPAYGPLTNGEGQPLVPGVEIPTATSLHTWVEFGYAMAKPTTSGWRLEMKDAGGRLFASCTAQERDLACN